MSWEPPGQLWSISSAMFWAPVYHAGEGRHLPDGVVREHRDQGVDVLGPERLHVALQHHLVLGSQVVLDGALRQLLLGQLGVGPLQRAVDGGDAGLEGGRGLLGRPAQHVAEDQDGALAWWEVLQRGHEGEPDGVAVADDQRRVDVGDVDHHVGHRLEPRHLGGLDELVAGLRSRHAEPGGQRSAALVLQVGQADVGRDPVEPGAHRRAALEVVVRLPGAEVGLLDHVLGVVHRAGHPVAVRGELATVLVGDAAGSPRRRGPARAASMPLLL